VIVVESDDGIRCALSDLLVDEGYIVVEAKNLQEASALIDATSVPMVLLIGDVNLADYGRLDFFRNVAANPVAHHAYIYLTSTPEHLRPPALVQVLETLDAPTLEKPYELASLLATVADAALQVHA
jgi:DNA-binding NtrC family response regulator